MVTTTKNCPYCDELISINAIKCKHCGSILINSSIPRNDNDFLTLYKLALKEKYEIIGEIGKGGMATVYKAVQRSLQRTVALKVIHHNLIHDSEFVERFHSEARIAASFNHPNIISIYDISIENGVHYIAMEYLEGDDLRQIIKNRGKLTIVQTIEIISAIASAIDYIHNRGFLHRDIKTSNIFITRNGRIVLMDFGIARALGHSNLSQTGSILGTPEYMSPEQAQGISLNKQSDLYSLGVVMFECLTGRLPFHSENPLSTIYHIINTPPPSINLLNKSVPKWLKSINEKLLAKSPKDRFNSGAELISALKSKQIIKGKIIPKSENKTLKFSSDSFLNNLDRSKNKVKSNLVQTNHSKRNFRKIILIFILVSIMSYSLVYIFNNYESLNNFITEHLGNNNFSNLSPEQKDKINFLLQESEKNFNANRIEESIEGYKQVLRIHQNDTKAIEKLDLIYSFILDNFNISLEQGKINESLYYLSIIQDYFPDKKIDIEKMVFELKIKQELMSISNILKSEKIDAPKVFETIDKLIDLKNSKSQTDLVFEFISQQKNRFLNIGEKLIDLQKLQVALNYYQKISLLYVNDNLITGNIEKLKKVISQDNYVEVPNLLFKDLEDASRILEINRLKLGSILKRAASDNLRGFIVEQLPQPGTKVKINSSIGIIIGD